MVVPRGPRLLPSAPFTLYVNLVMNGGLGSNLSKHTFYMQGTVAPISIKDTIWLLLTLTGKLAAYLLSLSLTYIISCSLDSHLESKAGSVVLSELSLSVLPRIFISFCCYVLRYTNIRKDFVYFILVVVTVAFIVVRVICACITLTMVQWYVFECPFEVFVIFLVASNSSAIWSGLL